MVILCGRSSKKKQKLYFGIFIWYKNYCLKEKINVILEEDECEHKEKILAIILSFMKILLAFLITICLVVGPLDLNANKKALQETMEGAKNSSYQN